jgi:GT2 family glycosyltransferase
MEKKISVVVPTYKRAALLSSCLIALSKQRMSQDDFEVIVVIDGPDAQTEELIGRLREEYIPSLSYITLSENSGPASARNIGWRNATAQLVAFTDDDCRPGPSWLSSLWRAYEESGYAEKIAFSGKVIVPLPERPTDFELNTAHLETADFITANCACTKAALEAVAGFDERFRMAWREDSDLEFGLLERGVPVLKVKEAIVVHPVRRARWGTSIREQRKTMFNALLYKKYPHLYREKIQRLPAWNYYVIIAGVLMIVLGLILDNKTTGLTGALLYIALTIAFILKRLRNTSRTTPHVIEMIATSLVIPFYSVYWTLYGSFKYRVLYY